MRTHLVKKVFNKIHQITEDLESFWFLEDIPFGGCAKNPLLVCFERERVIPLGSAAATAENIKLLMMRLLVGFS